MALSDLSFNRSTVFRLDKRAKGGEREERKERGREGERREEGRKEGRKEGNQLVVYYTNLNSR